MSEKQARTYHQPLRNHLMCRLAAAKWMYSIHPSPRVFRLRKTGSRSSKMSSSTERLTPSHLTKLTSGNSYSTSMGSPIDTPPYPFKSGTGSMPASNQSPKHTHPKTAPIPSTTTQMNTSKSLIKNSHANVTWAPYPNQKSSNLSDLFNLPPSPSFQNPESPENIVPFTISRIPTPPQKAYHPSTIPSTPIYSLAHGERSPQFASQSGTFHRALKPQFETSQKHTELSLFHPNNGQGSWSSSAKRINSQSTPIIISGSLLQEVSMDTLVTRRSTSSVPQVLAPCPNGSMTISFSEFFSSISQHTTRTVQNGIWKSWPTEGNAKTEAGYGSEDQTCRTVAPQNLMRTSPSPFRTSPRAPLAHLPMKNSHILMPTSTNCQINSESPGRSPKQSPSILLSPTSVFCGISRHAQFLYPNQKRKNTPRQSQNGFRKRGTPWTKLKNYMGNYFMHASWYRTDVRTSPAWRPCFAPFVTVLSCHTPHPKTHIMTFSGGATFSDHTHSSATSLAPATSPTLARTQARVLESALASQSQGAGVPGAFSQAGTTTTETLDGRKQSASNSLSGLYSLPALPATTSKSSATIGESLKDGGKDAAETNPQMKSSVESIISQAFISALFTYDTSPAKTTQQTAHQEEFTLPCNISSQRHQSQPKSVNSSSTLMPLSPSPSWMLADLEELTPRLPKQKTIQTPQTGKRPTTASSGGANKSPTPQQAGNQRTRWNAPLPLPTATSTAPGAYRSNLAPLLSPLFYRFFYSEIRVLVTNRSAK
jgi:hypothetical protein